MATYTIGHLIEFLIGWVMVLALVLILCTFIMATIKFALTTIFGSSESEAVIEKPKFKAKREPGRESAVEQTDMRDSERFAPVLSATAAELEAFDPAELEEHSPAPIRATKAASAKSASEEPRTLADRLASEFDARKVTA